jgi:hypothetical protein
MKHAEAAIELAKYWDRNGWGVTLHSDKLVEVLCVAFKLPVPPPGSSTWTATLVANREAVGALHNARKASN